MIEPSGVNKLGTEPGFEAASEPMRVLLDSIVVTAIEMREHFGHNPTADSIAAQEIAAEHELSGSWGTNVACDSQAAISLLVGTADQHINGITRLLAADVTGPSSLEVLARAAIESQARAHWLCEPTLGLTERVKRYQTERLYSATELLTLGLDRPHARSIIDKILDGANENGIPKLAGKKHTPPRFVDRPSATQLVRKLMLDDENSSTALGATAYRTYSAAVHGTMYALVRYVHPIAGTVKDGLGLGVIALSATEANQIMGTVLLGQLLLTERLVVFLGWTDYEPWKKSAVNARKQALQLLRMRSGRNLTRGASRSDRTS